MTNCPHWCCIGLRLPADLHSRVHVNPPATCRGCEKVQEMMNEGTERGRNLT
jgi:hypothetical protein